MPSEVSGPISVVNLYRFNTQKVLEHIGDKSINSCWLHVMLGSDLPDEDERGKGR